MSKISRYILFIGLILSVIAGSMGTYATWDIDPKIEYTTNPESLVFLFLSRFAAGASPFIFIVGVIELFRFLKRKLRIKQVSKISRYIFFIGLILGFVIASIGTYAEWDLNPQMEYTLNPEHLIFLFLGGLVIVPLPFMFVASMIALFRALKRKLADKGK